jgi:hypothetical protein
MAREEAQDSGDRHDVQEQFITCPADAHACYNPICAAHGCARQAAYVKPHPEAAE